MLQQTRVETVIPYFKRWMKRFPTAASLARASEQDVLREWEGLGYYSRARNLHKTARIITDEHGGSLPKEPEQLRKLPGIGRYTAAAIASIAHGADHAALDGNIKRVLSRVFEVDDPVDSPRGMDRLWKLANGHMPRGRAGDYNQALMDLGAAICLPKAPRCLQCPILEHCEARARGLENARPVRKTKAIIPHHLVAAAVIQNGNRVLLAKRPSNGLLGGLWEFPGGKIEPGESMEQGLRREILEELEAKVGVNEPFGVFRHAYTHYRITLHAFLCTLEEEHVRPIEAEAIEWVSPVELARFPMGKVDRLIADKLAAGNGNG